MLVIFTCDCKIIFRTKIYIVIYRIHFYLLNLNHIYIKTYQKTVCNSEADKKPWKDDGVYLITGGAGGIGMLFAKVIGIIFIPVLFAIFDTVITKFSKKSVSVLTDDNSQMKLLTYEDKLE